MERALIGKMSLPDSVFDKYLNSLLDNIGLDSTRIPLIIGKRPLTGTTTLTKRSGYLIIPSGGEFFYYKIDPPTPSGNHLYRFKPPAVRKEGFVVIDKDLYFVTFQDIERGVIRKSRKIEVKKGAITYEMFQKGEFKPLQKSEKDPAENPLGKSPNTTSSNHSGLPRRVEDESRLDEYFEDEDLEAANLAFKEQERTLQNIFFEKEGLDFEGCETEEIA